MIVLIKYKKKGFTLILVLIFFSILLIIGTALTSLAVSNYKMRNLRGDTNRAFYEAEAGIDQGYNIIRKVLIEAKAEETRLISENITNVVLQDKNNGNNNNVVQAVLLSPEEIVNSIKSYIQNNLVVSVVGIDKVSSAGNSTKYDTLFEDRVKVEVLGVVPFDSSGHNAEEYIISVKSSSKYNNVTRIITADYTIQYTYNSKINVEILNFKSQ